MNIFAGLSWYQFPSSVSPVYSQPSYGWSWVSQFMTYFSRLPTSSLFYLSSQPLHHLYEKLIQLKGHFFILWVLMRWNNVQSNSFSIYDLFVLQYKCPIPWERYVTLNVCKTSFVLEANVSTVSYPSQFVILISINVNWAQTFYLNEWKMNWMVFSTLK